LNIVRCMFGIDCFYCQRIQLTMSNTQFTIINQHNYLNIDSCLFDIEHLR